MRRRVMIGAAVLAAAAAAVVAPVRAEPVTPAPHLVPAHPGPAASGLDAVELPSDPKAARHFDLKTPAEAVGATSTGGFAAQARPLRRSVYPVTYDLNFVAIPLSGLPADRGFTQSDARVAVAGIDARMRQLTGGKIGYRFGSWNNAGAVPAGSFRCDIFDIDGRYGRFSRQAVQPGATDSITVYVTPHQIASESDCDYLGVAVIGGNVLHLNGLQYTGDGVPRERHLEQWVLAHELGHNLGLRHSDLRWARSPVVPTSPMADKVQPYGDHLDLMGGATSAYYQPDADWANWFLSAPTSGTLGVLSPGTASLPVVTRSGNYTINALYRDMGQRRAQGLILAGPPDSSSERGALWMLEYRSGTTPVDRSGKLDPGQFGRTHGLRIYSPQHHAAHQGRLYAVSTYQLVFGRSEDSLRRNVGVGQSVRLQGTSSSRTVTVTVLSQNSTSARVRIQIGTAVQSVTWPPAKRFRQLPTGRRLPLARTTSLDRTVTWRRTAGKACVVTATRAGSWLRKTKARGTCALTATAPAGLGAPQYRRTVTYRAR